MKIHGLNKTTLLDYPGLVAATIFTGNCNFRCPFCHNASLVLHPDSQPSFSEDEILTFLKKRKSVLKGVCITGGEPTLQPDLADFIRKIKDLGYLVKLDTNGYRPEVIRALCEEQLLDYLAMDIKTCFSKYPSVAGIPGLDVSKIKESVDYLMNGSIPYEFRTTIVPKLHPLADLLELANEIKGCSQYYLQPFVNSSDILADSDLSSHTIASSSDFIGSFSVYSPDELHDILSEIQKIIPECKLRGES